jgi:hypothetical protein
MVVVLLRTAGTIPRIGMYQQQQGVSGFSRNFQNQKLK